MNVESHRKLTEIDQRLAIVAALPLFLFGLLIAGIAAFLLIIGGPSQIMRLGVDLLWHNLAIAVSAISLLILVYAAVAAIKNRLAIWSYNWIGAVIVGLVVALNLVLDDRVLAFSKAVDITIVTLVLLSCLVIFYCVALKGWQHTGLISAGFCGMLGLSLIFWGVAGTSQSHIGLFSALLGLIEAILVYVFLRSRSKTVCILSIIGVGIVNIAVSWIIEAIFRSSNPSRDIDQFWFLAALLTGLLLGGTLSGMAGQFVRRRFGLLMVGKD
ncbi:MAG: hypothetical protein SXV54_14945 [Chloroflexota bacterium]|nr:hypothetical protein [Chloroflexota bacterium]